jgi:hypothetical protein
MAAGSPVEITSEALDQFSMAPLDGALFTTRAFVGCEFSVHLGLDRRRTVTAADETFFRELVDDATDNGLMLGHGTNKGFGWFAVSGERADG